MKRVFFSVVPMILMLLIVTILFSIEVIFMDQIIDLFNIEEIESFNTFNNGFILVLGLIAMYILSKYTMEINERTFRIFTFILNFLGIITIMTVLIRGAFIK